MKRYLTTAALIVATLVAAISMRGGLATAATADIGYRDFQFGSSCTSTRPFGRPLSACCAFCTRFVTICTT